MIKNDNKIKSFKSGLKKDSLESKVRFDLIPYELLKRLAEQFTGGANKYGVNNWKTAKGDEAHIFLEAAMRHVNQWCGEVDDGEDHAIAAITNIMMYEWHTKHKNEK